MSSPVRNKNMLSQQEIVIDIHVEAITLKMENSRSLRVVWSRGKKQAKTQYKVLTKDQDTAVFDEKFQINTVLDLDKDTGMPTKEKSSKLTVCLDKKEGGLEIAEVNFDMTDYSYDKYNSMQLPLKQSEGNTDIPINPLECFIKIGLKATKKDGLVRDRMTAIKKEMSENMLKKFQGDQYKDQLKKTGMSPEKMRDRMQSNQMNDAINNMINNEIEKLKKENRDRKREFEKKLNEKNSVINDLQTKLVNKDSEQPMKNEQENGQQQKVIEQKKAIEEYMEKCANLALLKNQFEEENKALKQALQNDGTPSIVNLMPAPGASDNAKFDVYSFERYDCDFLASTEKFLLKSNKREKFGKLGENKKILEKVEGKVPK